MYVDAFFYVIPHAFADFHVRKKMNLGIVFNVLFEVHNFAPITKLYRQKAHKMTENPYSDNGDKRVFFKDVNPEELKWHRDEEDRIVVPLNQNDWQFQRDNCLPEPINKEIEIKRGEWHRVIKGTTDLEVKIIKGI